MAQPVLTFFSASSGDPAADRRFDFACRLGERGDWADAADLFAQGRELAPLWPPFSFYLGEAKAKAGLSEDAAAAFRDYLALDPEDRMGAGVRLALLGAVEAPVSLPPCYVQSLFDQYAPRFDEALVEQLEYKTPLHLAQAVPGDFERLLDLGCGTGLSVAPFAARAQWKEGVDLSPAMVDEAQRKNLYDRLHVGDIAEFLDGTYQPYDLVLCADVIVYIGALETLFVKVSGALSANGIFAFSVQAGDGNWTLGADHRYVHGRAYVEKCVKAAGMHVLSCQDHVLRQDAGKPVPGMVFVCRKT